MPNPNRVALVTGGSRGIGFGIALKLAEAGFTMAISGRRAKEQVQPALDAIAERSPAPSTCRPTYPTEQRARVFCWQLKSNSAGSMCLSTMQELRRAFAPTSSKREKRALTN